MAQDGEPGTRFGGRHAALLERLGGALTRAQLDPDSSLGAAWTLGDYCLANATRRLSPDAIRTILPQAIVQKPLLNAAATSLPDGYAIIVFWPLILTLQGVAAAIWANALTAPWIGQPDKCLHDAEFASPTPNGFELYRGLLGAPDFKPEEMRSGIPARYVDAIVAAGDERFHHFIATWKTGIEFIWNHECAHILYGHCDYVDEAFGVLSSLYEDDTGERSEIPGALSAFIEHVADMDGAMQIFAAFYGSALSGGTEAIDPEAAAIAASAALGILLAIYVLHQGAAMRGAGLTVSRTHPPLRHRAAWVLGAESRALDAVRDRFGLEQATDRAASAVRNAARDLLRSVAATHQSLHDWIGRIDQTAEDEMNAYVAGLPAASAPYFSDLHRCQLV